MAPPALVPIAAQSIRKPSLSRPLSQKPAAKPRSQRADEAKQLMFRQLYMDKQKKCLIEGNDKECPKHIRDGMLACVPKGFTAARWLSTDPKELTEEMKTLGMGKEDIRTASICIRSKLWKDAIIGAQLQALKDGKTMSKAPASILKKPTSVKKARTATGYPKLAAAAGGGWW